MNIKDGWRDFETTVRIRAPRYLKDGNHIEYVEYEVAGSVHGVDHPEIDDIGVWINGYDLTEHLKPEIVDDIYEVLFEKAAREEI